MGLLERSRRHRDRREQGHRPRDEPAVRARRRARWSARRARTRWCNETVALIRTAGGEAVARRRRREHRGRREGDRRRRRARRSAGVDTLVNNAGDGGPTKPIQDYTTDDWFYTVNSCLTSAYMCSRFAVPAMIAAGRGAIVNIASMAGRRGLMYRVGYCSAKAGQIGMTYGLALELGRTTSPSTRSRRRGRRRSHRSRHPGTGRRARRRRRADAQVVRRALAAAAHVDGRGHRVARRVPLQRRARATSRGSAFRSPPANRRHRNIESGNRVIG